MFSLLFLLKIGFILYSVFAILMAIVLHLLSRYFKETNSKTALRMTKFLKWVLIGSVVFGVVIWIDVLIVEPNWIEVKHITIESPLFTPSHEKLKIVQISYLHIETFGLRERGLIRAIDRLKPDIILNTGDYIDSREGWNVAMKVVSQLKAKKGHYSILGNTDTYFGSETEIVDWLNKVGVTPIVIGNLKIQVDDRTSLTLVGMSDRYSSAALYGDRQMVPRAFQGVPLNDPKILMIHDPDDAKVDTIAEYHPQLVLAGHTHGGQFGIDLIRRYSTYAERSEFMAGKFMIHGFPLYVNRGIGMKTLNLRFLCRPEITVIHLRKGKE